MVSTHLKNISQNGKSSPNRGENKKCLKPPPASCAENSQLRIPWHFVFYLHSMYNGPFFLGTPKTLWFEHFRYPKWRHIWSRRFIFPKPTIFGIDSLHFITVYVEIMRCPSGVVSQGNDVERKDKFEKSSGTKWLENLKSTNLVRQLRSKKINLPLEKGPV